MEADDVIGSLAKAGEEAGWNVVISTGDKDMGRMFGRLFGNANETIFVFYYRRRCRRV